jgi:hypothetical protein
VSSPPAQAQPRPHFRQEAHPPGASSRRDPGNSILANSGEPVQYDRSAAGGSQLSLALDVTPARVALLATLLRAQFCTGRDATRKILKKFFPAH